MTDRPVPTADRLSPLAQGLPAAARPSLTDRRRAETQLEIAITAAALFAERGVEGTGAEEIARASGVALRTFYRYFRTKEEAVAPLLAAGGGAGWSWSPPARPSCRCHWCWSGRPSRRSRRRTSGR